MARRASMQDEPLDATRGRLIERYPIAASNIWIGSALIGGAALGLAVLESDLVYYRDISWGYVCAAVWFLLAAAWMFARRPTRVLLFENGLSIATRVSDRFFPWADVGEFDEATYSAQAPTLEVPTGSLPLRGGQPVILPLKQGHLLAQRIASLRPRPASAEPRSLSAR